MPEPILKDTFSENRIYIRRVLVALVIVLLLTGLLIARYIQLQISEHDIYTTQSERNRVHARSIAPKRGLIFDRNGVLLAENQPAYTLTVVSERVANMSETLTLLQSILDISDADIKKFLARQKSHRPFEAAPLRFRLSEEEIALIAVNRYRLPGVGVEAQLARNYPMKNLFAHVLGYVGRINEKEQQEVDPQNYSGTHHIGKIGLEKYYEEILHGEVGYENVETDARGKVLRVLERTDPVPGKDLTLYIDSYVQKVAYEALGEQRGSVVAIDPVTGGVIAIVSTPGFDPNLFVSGISNKAYSALRDSIDLPLFDRSLQGQYPPASTVKPIIGLAGLNAGTITPETTVYDPGWYRLPNDERFYRDWKRQGHGAKIDLRQAVIESCDTYFYHLAYNLGIDEIHAFLSQFGLGEPTGIDLTSERKGLLPSKEWKRSTRRGGWFHGETLSVGIGQGYMLATPIQLAVATATIASRGLHIQPRVLQSAEGLSLPPQRKLVVDVDDENHWQVIAEAMHAVVHSSKGTAKRISAGASYEMAGKTGTAQVVGIKQGEKYDAELLKERNRDHALYIGYAPYENPQIAVAVVVENGEHGSSTAAPIARKVFDAYLLPAPIEREQQVNRKRE